MHQNQHLTLINFTLYKSAHFVVSCHLSSIQTPVYIGKTMMAKAIAHSCSATFINVRLSTLQNKW